MPRKSDPNSFTSRVASLHADGVSVEEIAAKLGVDTRSVNRALWAVRNRQRVREKDRERSALRYADSDYREKHIARVMRSQRRAQVRARALQIQTSRSS